MERSRGHWGRFPGRGACQQTPKGSEGLHHAGFRGERAPEEQGQRSRGRVLARVNGEFPVAGGRDEGESGRGRGGRSAGTSPMGSQLCKRITPFIKLPW